MPNNAHFYFKSLYPWIISSTISELAILTHTPNPMNFLTEVLNRPKNEKAFLILPVGYPKDPVYVPQLKRKKLDEIVVFYA